MSTALIIVMVLLFVIFMIMSKKGNTKQEDIVATKTKPEHILLIKKWLNEKKNITNVSVKVNLLDQVPPKLKTKEEKNKDIFVMIFQTHNNKTQVTSDEVAVKVECDNIRVGKKEYKYKYTVTEELDVKEIKEKFQKQIENHKKLSAKEQLNKDKQKEKHQQKLVKIKEKQTKSKK